MGVLAVGIGKVETALTLFKAALEANPSIEQFWISYIDALIKINRNEEAQTVLEQAKRFGLKLTNFKNIDVNNAQKSGQAEDDLKMIMAKLQHLYKNGETSQVYQLTTELLKQHSHNVIFWNLIGIASLELNKFVEAIHAFQKATTINPKSAAFFNNLGTAFKNQGRTQDAAAAYKKAISLQPDFAEAHRQLASIQTYNESDAHFIEVKNLSDHTSLDISSKSKLNYALAKMYEDIGYLKYSFKHLKRANDLQKEIRQYQLEEDQSLFRKLVKSSSQFSSCITHETKNLKYQPVFIIGMPRSGTTLVEQILSCHSEINGLGELNHVKNLGQDLCINTSEINERAILQFKHAYLAKLPAISEDISMVTDKMPHNFRFVPLICSAFPEAKIIHVKRDARATCWSNYKQYFPADDYRYTNDLNDCVHYYKLYQDLMEKWSKHFGNRIYELDYEKLVTDQEVETRNIIEHLALSWEDACLSPHLNKRVIKTASQQQVRRKVYENSSGDWKKYEKYLSGVFDNL